MSNVSKHPSVRKTRSRYTKQGRRVRGIEPIIKKSWQDKRRCHSATIRSAYGFDNNKNAGD